jgi:hypothetical protein
MPARAPIQISTPPNAQDDEIDDAEREGDDGEDQREPRRPPARRAIGEEDAVGCAERSTHAPVERAHESLRRATQLPEAADPRCRVATRTAGGRHRERGDVARQEAPLLIERERHAEIDELGRDGRQGRLDAHLLGQAGSGGSDERSSGRHGIVSRDREVRATWAEIVEDHDCDRARGEWRPLDEAGRASTAE